MKIFRSKNSLMVKIITVSVTYSILLNCSDFKITNNSYGLIGEAVLCS